MSGNAAHVEFRNSYASRACAKKHSCDSSYRTEFLAAMLALPPMRMIADKARYRDERECERSTWCMPLARRTLFTSSYLPRSACGPHSDNGRATRVKHSLVVRAAQRLPRHERNRGDIAL